jgi:hypothetical protein
MNDEAGTAAGRVGEQFHGIQASDFGLNSSFVIRVSSLA